MFINLNILKIATEVFLKPSERHSYREIAKKTGLSTATVSKACGILQKEKIIKTENVAKSILVSADMASSDYRFYKRLFNINSLKELTDQLNKDKPLAVILYGSYGRGEDTEQSDIDLVVIGKAPQIDLGQYEKKLNRKIHILSFNSEKDIPENLRQSINNGFIFHGAII